MVPTLIPHNLDLKSLDVLDSYLTAVGLSMVGEKLPDANVLRLFEKYPHLRDTDVPGEFEPVLALLRGRLVKDKQAMKCESGCSETVKKLTSGGLSKWTSSLSVQSMQKLNSIGAPKFIEYIAKSVHIQDPQFAKSLDGILTSPDPVVYSTLYCDKKGSCNYLFLVGNSTVGVATDLLVVKESAQFQLAPDLVIVRETNTSIIHQTNSTVDKIHKIPRSITKEDIKAVLAYFEVAVLDRLSAPISRSTRVSAPAPAPAHALAPAPTPDSPDMDGKKPVPVPEWQDMLKDAAGNSASAAALEGDIAAGMAIGGPVGAAIGGLIGLIPQIASIFHTSHTHSEVMIGELQNKGFSHFNLHQSGPIYYHQVPYHVVQSGKQVNPVELIMNSLLNGHLSDVEKEADQNDIKTYVMTLANGWSSGSNVFVSSGIHYNTKDGGGAKVVKFVTNADIVNQHASILFYATNADIKLADRLLLYRVTDTSANILHDESNQKDEIRRIPREITYNDTQGLFNFFDILAAQAFASSLGLCAALGGGCEPPSIKPKSNEIVV
jgi:hypothetical protein